MPKLTESKLTESKLTESTRIVIVDDDPDFREFVHIVLEAHGYEVHEAHNAMEGLALMRATAPHLLLLDAMMSYELAGVGMIRSVRTDPQLAHIPLILISAVLSEDEDRFLPADERTMVDRFLSKPISPDVLLTEVASILSNAGPAHSTPDTPGSKPDPKPAA